MRRAARGLIVWLVPIAAMSLLADAAPAAQRPAHARLFPPEDLGVLESPDRDLWQEPDWIMDQLKIADGSRVADLGAGGGWFTMRLARRVGPNGMVYAEDIQPQMIASIRRRVDDQGFTNVTTILGTADDPRLPSNLHAVLIVDTYPQFRDPVGLLRHVSRALLPNGLLGVVDFKRDGAGGPGPPPDERLGPDAVRSDAEQAGLHLQRLEMHLKYQYLLVFEKGTTPADERR
jgi:ubiquinone/menaquinone biosynthesis C-methylase UbiE